MLTRDVGAVQAYKYPPLPPIKHGAASEPAVEMPRDAATVSACPGETAAPASSPLSSAMLTLRTTLSALCRSLLPDTDLHAYAWPHPSQPSDQPNAERIRWLKQQIESKNSQIESVRRERSCAENERNAKLREKSNYENESYSLGQQINAKNYEASGLQTELYRVKEKLRDEKDSDERWRLEARRSNLDDQIYRLHYQAKDLQYKRNDVDYKVRECGQQAESLQNKQYSLSNEIERISSEVGNLKDELWRLERG
jgi:peptidoglycan hydrolase CwlO-like protein